MSKNLKLSLSKRLPARAMATALSSTKFSKGLSPLGALELKPMWNSSHGSRDTIRAELPDQQWAGPRHGLSLWMGVGGSSLTKGCAAGSRGGGEGQQPWFLVNWRCWWSQSVALPNRTFPFDSDVFGASYLVQVTHPKVKIPCQGHQASGISQE